MTALRFYLARQSFVLPGHVEQTVAGFGNDLVLRPLPELSRLLAVMRDALKLSVCTGRRNIGWRKAPPTMIAPTEQTWRCGGSRRSTVYLATALLHVNREASVCLLRQTAIGP